MDSLFRNDQHSKVRAIVTSNKKLLLGSNVQLIVICAVVQFTYAAIIGVNHRERVPQNLNWKTLMQIVQTILRKMSLRIHLNMPFN